MPGLDEVFTDEDSFPFGSVTPQECPRQPHRGPQGPNEDLAQCYRCGSIDHRMRPWGETYGLHLPDCSLAIWHSGYCEGGGAGHPEAPVIRGYWPELEKRWAAEAELCDANFTCAVTIQREEG